MNTEKAIAVMAAISKEIEKSKDELSALDQAIGDGDHGFNMARGFEAVMSKLNAAPTANVGDVLKTTAMALISNVGGASGPLYGTLFLKMSGAAAGKTELDLAGFAAALKDGVKGVQDRGKAALGEKTMLDVLIPVTEFLEKEASAGHDGVNALEAAAALAEKCRDGTKDIIATKGRASYLGERSKGHIDPGAASSCLMLKVLAKAAA